MNNLVKTAIFSTVTLAVAPALANDEPVLYRSESLNIPHGVVLDDRGLQFYQDIRLEEQDDGSFAIAAAEEGVLAMVDSAEATVSDDGDSVDVAVQGNLSTPCDALMEPMVTRDGDLFGIVLAQKNTLAENEACVQTLDPFETTVTLDVSDMGAGDYTVNVNNEAETGFTL